MCKNIYFYNENCFDSMKRMMEKSYKVDMVLTSPPYNTGRTQQSKRAFDNYECRYDIHIDDMTDEEYREWTVNLFNSFDGILNTNGVIAYNISYGSENPNCLWLAMSSLLERTNFMIADVISWKKSAALPNNVSPNKLTRIVEFVFILCRKSEYKTYMANKKVKSVSKTGQKYYENVYNFIEAPNNDGACELNKATYSSKLCEELLTLYARDGSIIYDPFMGTGTTAAACLKMREHNYTCIGSELSPKQVEYSKNRIKELEEKLDKNG